MPPAREQAMDIVRGPIAAAWCNGDISDSVFADVIAKLIRPADLGVIDEIANESRPAAADIVVRLEAWADTWAVSTISHKKQRADEAFREAAAEIVRRRDEVRIAVEEGAKLMSRIEELRAALGRIAGLDERLSKLHDERDAIGRDLDAKVEAMIGRWDGLRDLASRIAEVLRDGVESDDTSVAASRAWGERAEKVLDEARAAKLIA